MLFTVAGGDMVQAGGAAADATHECPVTAYVLAGIAPGGRRGGGPLRGT